MKARSAVILIEDDKIALIERWRSGKHYLVFPGGKVKSGETAIQAAVRETEEELGLKVLIGTMVAEVWYLGSPQYYFLAKLIEGQFGHGTGSEMSSAPDSEKGSYNPVWMEINILSLTPLLPKIMAEFLCKSYIEGWPETPLVITDNSPDQMGNL